MERALHAQSLLLKRLQSLGEGRPFPEWFLGMGIGHTAAGEFFLEVHVSELTPRVNRSIPREIDGLPVRIETAGEIHAAHRG